MLASERFHGGFMVFQEASERFYWASQALRAASVRELSKAFQNVSGGFRRVTRRFSMVPLVNATTYASGSSRTHLHTH